MLEVKIPQEIRKYEAKMVGPFTARQTICLGIAALSGWLLYNALKDVLSKTGIIGMVICVGMIAGLFGWAKPYGMTFEKFIGKMIFAVILSPAKRYFKSGQTIKDIEKAASKAEEKELTISKDMTREEKRKVKKAIAERNRNMQKVRKKYVRQISA